MVFEGFETRKGAGEGLRDPRRGLHAGGALSGDPVPRAGVQVRAADR